MSRGMMMASLPALVITVDDATADYGQTVNVSKVQGPPGTPTYQWAGGGSFNVFATSPNSPSTSFYAANVGDFTDQVSCTATLNGRTDTVYVLAKAKNP